MTFIDGTMPCVRVRITIEGDYPVALGDEDAYPGCFTAEECFLQDVQSVQNGVWSLPEMIDCLENQDDSVELVPYEE